MAKAKTQKSKLKKSTRARKKTLKGKKGAFQRTHCVVQDVTTSKEARLQLEYERNKFRTYLDIAGVMLIAIDMHGIVTMINQKGCEILGYKREEILGKNWFKNFVPKRIVGEIGKVSRQLLEGRAKSAEYHENPIVTKDGKERIIAWHNTVLRDDRGEVVGHLSSGEDVTDQRIIEERLRRQATIVEQVHDAIITADMSGNITSWNNGATRLFGYSSDEALGKHVTIVFPKDQKIIFKDVIKRLKQCDSYSFENEMLHKSDRYLYAHLSLSLFRDNGDKPTMVIIYASDTTDRKRVEESLRESERRLREAQRIAAMGDFTWDVETGAATWSDGLYDLLGYDKSETIDFAKVNAEIHHPEDLECVTKWLKDSMESDSGVLPPREYRLIRKNGDVIYTRTLGIIQKDRRGSRRVIGIVQDITERKKAEKELLQSEERFKTAGQLAYDLIYEWDVKTDSLTWYGRIDEMLGFKHGEISRDIATWLDLIHPDDRQILDNAVELHRVSTDPINYDYRIRHRDGDYRYWTDHALPFLDDKGRPYKWIGVCTDVTDRKNAEEMLLASKKFLDTIVDMSPFPMWVAEPSGMIVRTNDALCRTLNLSDDRIVNRYNVLHDDNLVEQGVMEMVHGVIEKQEPARFSIPWKASDAGDVEFVGGRDLYIDVSMFPIVDQHGKLKNIVCQWVDITAQKMAEEEIKGVARFPNENPNPVFRMTDAGKILYANASAERLLFGGREAKGRAISESFREAVDQVLKSGSQKMECEIEIGGQVYSWDVAVIKNAGYINLYGENITDRRKAEEELAEYRKHLEELVAERTMELRKAQEQLVRKKQLTIMGQLAGSVAHEIRNPLGAMANAIYMLKALPSEEEEKRKKYLEMMDKLARDANRIITDLLGISRLKRAEEKAVKVADVFTMSINSNPVPEGVMLKRELPEDLPDVYINPEQMIQVFSNLLTNAYHAMPDGGEIAVSAEVLADEVRVSIADTGCGIAAADIERLFEPLFTTRAKGIGLGLTVSKSLVELNRGVIEVESEVGKGTTFIVILPTSPRLDEPSSDNSLSIK